MAYRFTKFTKDTDSMPTVEVFLPSDGTPLLDVLESFEDFLRACGYQFRGNLEIVDWDHSS